jgi:hypothetical protein
MLHLYRKAYPGMAEKSLHGMCHWKAKVCWPRAAGPGGMLRKTVRGMQKLPPREGHSIDEQSDEHQDPRRSTR